MQRRNRVSSTLREERPDSFSISSRVHAYACEYRHDYDEMGHDDWQQCTRSVVASIAAAIDDNIIELTYNIICQKQVLQML